MQEFFFTILSIWAIWKIFSLFSSPRSSGPTYRQSTHHHHYYNTKKSEGDIRVEMKKPPVTHIPADEGEYVDFEDVK